MKQIILFLLIAVTLACSKKDPPVVSPPVVPPTQTAITPTITGFAPLSAKVTEEVTITGTNFGTDINAVNVQFADGANIKPKSVTTTQIVVVVPATAITGQIKVILTNASPITSSSSFTLVTTLPLPTITGVSPLSGKVGDEVTISGTNFGTDINAVNVQFADGAIIKPKSVTTTQIIVVVPAMAITGQIKVTVANTPTVTSTSSFTVTAPPTITGFYTLTPTRGGETIIYGTNFGTDVNAIKVQFGKSELVTPREVGPTYLIVKVPITAVTGYVRVVITNKPIATSKDMLKFDYVVKTSSIIEILAFTETVGTELKTNRIYATDATGNVVDVVTGNELKFSFVSNVKNENDYKLSMYGTFSHVTYPNTITDKTLLTITPSDSLVMPTLKVTGTRALGLPYDQVNLILMKQDIFVVSGIIEFRSSPDPKLITPANIKAALNGTFKRTQIVLRN